MPEPYDSDEALGARIARGDWAPDAPPPAMARVTTLVRRRRRVRNAAVIAGTSAAGAAVAVAAVVVAPMLGDRETPTASAPSTTREAPSPRDPGWPPCRNGETLISAGPAGPSDRYNGRLTQVVRITNIGDLPCDMQVPQLSVVTTAGAEVPVMPRVSMGRPYLLRPTSVLDATVIQPSVRSCGPASGADAADTIVATANDGFSYSFPMPRMRVVGCDPPTLIEVDVDVS